MWPFLFVPGTISGTFQQLEEDYFLYGGADSNVRALCFYKGSRILPTVSHIFSSLPPECVWYDMGVRQWPQPMDRSDLPTLAGQQYPRQPASTSGISLLPLPLRAVLHPPPATNIIPAYHHTHFFQQQKQQ
jgi:hypothetical protein